MVLYVPYPLVDPPWRGQLTLGPCVRKACSDPVKTAVAPSSEDRESH